MTAGNASPISDGAAALVLGTRAEAERLGTALLARILGHASHAQEPGWFTTAPIFAIRKLQDRLGWSGGCRSLRDQRGLRGGRDGGDAGPRHPAGPDQRQRRGLRAGASDRLLGARIVVTLVHALRARGLRRGIAAICIGGGEATAMAVEII